MAIGLCCLWYPEDNDGAASTHQDSAERAQLGSVILTVSALALNLLGPEPMMQAER